MKYKMRYKIMIITSIALIGIRDDIIGNQIRVKELGISTVNKNIIIMSTMIIPLITKKENKRIKSIEVMCIIYFMIENIVIMYIILEIVIIPMIGLIGERGKRKRIKGSKRMVVYTVGGSILLIISVITVYRTIGTLGYEYIRYKRVNRIIEVRNKSRMVEVGLLIGFLVKIPQYPYHRWLPEAHSEAPTEGSITLAGILLKLGGYGLLRMISIIGERKNYYIPIITVQSIMGMLYGGIMASREIDMKKVIANGSIAHMNIAVIGITVTKKGAIGGYMILVTHGIVTSGMFYGVGVLYKRYRTRNIKYYRGIIELMPEYTVKMIIIIIVNMGIPITGNYIGELIIMIETYRENGVVGTVITTSIIITGIYGIRVITKMVTGTVSRQIRTYKDLTKKEEVKLRVIIVLTMLIGVKPEYITRPLEYVV